MFEFQAQARLLQLSLVLEASQLQEDRMAGGTRTQVPGQILRGPGLDHSRRCYQQVSAARTGRHSRQEEEEWQAPERQSLSAQRAAQPRGKLSQDSFTPSFRESRFREYHLTS